MQMRISNVEFLVKCCRSHVEYLVKCCRDSVMATVSLNTVYDLRDAQLTTISIVDSVNSHLSSEATKYQLVNHIPKILPMTVPVLH